MTEKDLENSIDSAITSCKEVISTYRRSSLLLLMGILTTLFGIFTYFLFIYQDSKFSYKEQLKDLTEKYQMNKAAFDTLYRITPDSIKKSRRFDFPRYFDTAQNDSLKSETNSSLINYGIYLFGIVVISILTGLYRLHIKEIGKAEQNLVAFYRIRIAGNNYNGGFDTEVRRALTDNAFYYNSESNGLFGSRKRVESPVPGHPGSDVVAAILNKLLENVEIKPKN